MSDLSKTQMFTAEKTARNNANFALMKVYAALKEKGYEPASQIVGYIMSGDPSYITSHNNARAELCKIERNELLEEIVNFYLENNA